MTYGLVSRQVKGYAYFAEGYIDGFPFRYSLFATTIARAEPSEETTVAYRAIVSEILRLEKREPYRRAIYALWFHRSPNFVIRLIATASSGKQIPLLDEGIYIYVPHRDTVTLVRRICEGLGAIAQNLYTDTKKLVFVSQHTIRESLLYASPRTNQFWLNATISAYVRLISD